ncbi:MAG: alpha/beta hydrolase, partial [Pseudomonadota bacterium]
IAAAASALGTGDRLPTCAGHSLGTGVAAAMAAEGRCARLALVAAYTSLPDVAAGLYPFLPAHLLMADRYDTLSRAPGLQGIPTLLIHGEDDRTIPAELSVRLHTVLPGSELRLREDRGHNDVLDEDTLDAIAEFVLGGAHADGAPAP